MRNKLLYIILLSLLFQNVRAQQFPIKHYSTNSGLSNSNVYKIHQDRRGLIWFSTGDGLSQFDGSNFKNYFLSNGLSSNDVMSVSESINGIKYISTYGGGISIMTDSSISKLRISKQVIPQYIFSTVVKDNKIWFINVDSARRLQAIISDRIFLISKKSKTGRNVNFNKFLSKNDEILLATSNGVYKLVKDTVLIPIFTDITNGDEVLEIKSQKPGQYWLGMREKIILVENGKIKEEYRLQNRNEISSLLIDRNGRVWISVADIGVFLIDNGIHDITKLLGLDYVTVNDLFEDLEGNIWFATAGQGVFLLRNLNTMYYAPVDNALGMACKSIIRINESELLIGSKGQISKWKNGNLETFKCELLNTAELIYCIKKVDDVAYIGTPYKLIKKDLFPPYREKIISTRNGQNGVISIFEDSKKGLWAGSFSTLYTIRNDSLLEVSTPGIPQPTRYNCFAENKDGEILLGTNIGLAKWKNNKFKIQQISNDENTNKINGLHYDRHGQLWMATSNGLILESRGNIKVINTNDGLSHNHCFAMAEDADKVWVGTLKGLNLIDINNLKIAEYFSDVYPDEIYFPYFYSHGELLVGSLHGLSLIKVDTTRNRSKTSKLYITTVKTKNHQFNYPKSITLPYEDNLLTIEFIGISFHHSNLNQYKYKIVGADDDWHITTNNTLELSGLRGGNYTFQLCVKEEDGSWSKPIFLPIGITIPLWKERWFVIGSIVIPTIILIYLFSTFWINRRQSIYRTRLMSYSKTIYLKQQALSALINPHFIFNCMNSIQHYLNRKDNDAANSYLSDFASLIRMTMEDAQSAFISLDRELQRIKKYLALEKLRFGKKLEYTINIDDRLELNKAQIPNMILQPYIENAIWHGIAPRSQQITGKLLLEFQMMGQSQIRITIEDNGEGISKNNLEGGKGHKSYGMKLTQQRISLLQKMLDQQYSIKVYSKNEDGKAVGTIVEINLPLNLQEEDFSKIEKEFDSF